jgi:alpha-N-arabinofuranosidase
VTALLTAPPTAAEPARASVTARAAKADPPVILRISARNTHGKVSPLLAGTNHRYMHNGYGSWDPRTDSPREKLIRGAREIGLNLIRFPGGSAANLYDWKQAIGPTEDRGCQVNGKWGQPRIPAGEYGVLEHMRLARNMGAQTHITVPFVTETPADAADWVEYLNARVGADPNNDGVDWAAKRRRHQQQLGLPVRAYNVTRWTIGNEPYLAHERYWMSPDGGTALRQYIRGGTETYDDQLVGRNCRRSGDASEGTGSGSQRFEVLYPPVVGDSQTITVGGDVWREVDELTAAHQGDKVYTFDNGTGHIRFGDGSNGARPRDGQVVRADYTGKHAGFMAFARAMHEVDPKIDVCSEWGQSSFVQAMGKRPYDCLAVHPYTFNARKWRSVRDAYEHQMLGEMKAAQRLSNLKKMVARHTNGDSDVVVTEYGALSAVPQPRFPQWESSLLDALYMGSAVTHFIQKDVAWAEGGALVSRGMRGWLSASPHFVVSPAGRALELLRPVLNGGSRVVNNRLFNVPMRRADYAGEKFTALVATVTRDRKGLNVVLVNRDAYKPVTVHIRNPQMRLRPGAQTWRLSGERLATANTVRAPRRVRVVQRELRLPRWRQFPVTVPAHTVMRLRLHRR